MNYVIKQGDTTPSIYSIVSSLDGVAIDFTGATVAFKYRPKGGGSVTSRVGTCTVLSAASARLEYSWVSGDTATAGDFDAEWEVTLTSGRIITFPKSTYITFSVVPDLR